MRVICTTCNGHRGELDHNQRMWACNDCDGLGYHEEDEMDDFEAAVTETDADNITLSYHRTGQNAAPAFYCANIWNKASVSHANGFGDTPEKAFAEARRAYAKQDRPAERAAKIAVLERQLAEVKAA